VPAATGLVRYLATPDIAGPKVRLGAVWGVLSGVVVWWGAGAVAVLFGLTAAVAGLQTAYSRRRGPARPNRVVAGLLPLAATLAAVGGPVPFLVVVLAGVAGAMAAAGRRRLGGGSAAALATLGCSLPLAVGVGSIVLVRGEAGVEATLALVALVALYDTGCFLVGAGSASLLDGPLAGAIGVLVGTFTLTVLEPARLDDPRLWLLGVVTALAAPAGQAVASLALAQPNAFGPALRRLDSLLLVAPMWYAVLALGAQLPNSA
jgi:hypothetical protein